MALSFGFDVNIGPTERVISALAGASLLIAARRAGSARAVLALTGASLIGRAATGHSFLYQALDVDAGGGPMSTAVPVRATVTIARPIEEVYRFWRDLGNLPRFMRHIESVESEGRRSHWRARGPGGVTLEWDAELIEDRENELIGWCSLPGALLQHAGGVRFHPAPGGRGTEVHLRIVLTPTSGPGGAAARLSSAVTQEMLREDLRRLKHVLEAGEVPTIAGQTSGRARPERREAAQ